MRRADDDHPAGQRATRGGGGPRDRRGALPRWPSGALPRRDAGRGGAAQEHGDPRGSGGPPGRIRRCASGGACDPDVISTRATELVANLVEPAKSTALEKLGESERARSIATGWLRAKLEPSAVVKDADSAPDAFTT